MSGGVYGPWRMTSTNDVRFWNEHLRKENHSRRKWHNRNQTLHQSQMQLLTRDAPGSAGGLSRSRQSSP
eukprot:6426545-Prymnesium_polylepis.1